MIIIYKFTLGSPYVKNASILTGDESKNNEVVIVYFFIRVKYSDF